MADPERASIVRAARQTCSASLWLMVVGPSILLVYAWVEVLNNPGVSLVDGYWIGRLPWVPLGVVVSLVGAVGGLLAGSVAIAAEGGWWRRILIVPAFAGAGLWWAAALGVLPFPRFTGPDPVTFAYTLPATAVLLVLMPAALLATLSLTPRGIPRPGVDMRPVPPASGTALSPRRPVEPPEDDSER